MLKIHSFDLRWTLPSRMDETRQALTIEIDGKLVEAREVIRVFDHECFRKYLISVIPADRREDPAEE